MATPTILINNSTGSDTAASGAGPSAALTGTSASTSSTGLVVTLDGSPDLTGILTDGSHVIWISTASGRQFAAITAKDNTAKTVTTTTAFTASLTGQAWAIGGKRATFDNVNTRKLFSADAASGWIVDPAETGTVYTLTSTLNVGVSGLSVASSSTNRPTLTTSVNSTRLVTYTGTCAGMAWRHVKFSTTATTRSSCLFPSATSAINHTLNDCVFDGFATAIDGTNGAGFTFPGLALDACEFKNCTTSVVVNNSINLVVTATDCFFHDNAATVFLNCGGLVAERCVFSRNTRCVSGGTSLVLRNCDVHGSTDTTLANAAVAVVSSVSNMVAEVTGNVFYGNAATALLISGDAGTPIVRYNAFGANAADRSGVSAAATDITLTADPFTSASTNDFTLNGTAGGGAACKGVLNNVVAPGLVGTAHGDLGAFQSAPSASGPIGGASFSGGFQ